MPMNALRDRRCFHHPHREAVARCPECRRFYCRECAVEHDSRLLCADCLARTRADGTARRPSWPWHLPLRLLTGLVGLWFLFYVMGRALLLMPTAFHEGGRTAAPTAETGGP